MQEQAERATEQLNAQVAEHRRQFEQEIGDLEQRRDAVLAEMERLSSQLVGTATEHRPSDPPSGEEVIAVVDPDEEPTYAAPFRDEDDLPEDAEADDVEFEDYEDEVEAEDEAELEEIGGETAEWDAAGEMAEHGDVADSERG